MLFDYLVFGGDVRFFELGKKIVSVDNIQRPSEECVLLDITYSYKYPLGLKVHTKTVSCHGTIETGFGLNHVHLYLGNNHNKSNKCIENKLSNEVLEWLSLNNHAAYMDISGDELFGLLHVALKRKKKSVSTEANNISAYNTVCN